MTSVETGPGIDLIQVRIESLSSKMDTLISIQEKVLSRLDSMSQDIDGIERDMETLKLDKEEISPPPATCNEGPARGVRGEMKEMCQEMSSIMTAVNQRSEQQAQKLEGMERLVLSIQQVVSFIGETVKTSKVMELMFKGPAARKHKTSLSLGPKNRDNKGKQTAKKQASGEVPPGKKAASIKPVKGTEELTLACEPSSLESTHKLKLHGPKHFLSSKKSFNFLKDHKVKDGKEKSRLSFKGLKAQKKKKPPDTTDAASLKKQALLLEEVQKLNRENAERSTVSVGMEVEATLSQNLLDFILEETKAPIAEQEELSEEERDVGVELKEEEEEVVKVENGPEEMPKEEKEEITKVPEEEGREEGSDSVPAVETESCESEQVDEMTTSSKRRVTEEDLELEDHKKSRVEEGDDEEENQAEVPEDVLAVFKADGVEIHIDFSKQKQQEDNIPDESECEQFFIDCTPPPPAPFSHRVVSAKPNQINNFYTINRQEILGGGRFGQVHKCIENSSGLTLAAKIIKARSQKEKEVVKNEIQVMNQLDHANLIQLYAAYESRNDIILVLEYVDGGELFDRIIDENYKLTELDTVMFIRQICEGLRYMHKMYILHLDLKPENILCVSRLTNKVKIIDFGLARKYKPREKLRVNFGTPEFLAPEVINYDFVSFNTDMWSLGVIAYMLLSGLSPFLGDDDNETLNNILSCQWNFEEDEFLGISDEAKDFISKLLVFNKSWRIGAGEALKHPWLSDPELHHLLHGKRNMCRSRRNSCVPPPES
ncbi:LOW QUALITY PROTEIN: myosin light chain kinase 2, skeletal/cardiac muscle [Colossoma macropomum]|uniref:LOW QUALITY PROTEIN: myosin light chain kinase 2, skeletal/cardiac muscle n=1 Tax=Colossoma macropomum TaxID=42526 RepID=UPI001864EB60|nr:LOW QUALITY PROTEIN: myosin light chain kinase 2, skeletal/cardiac muscle [Colossoma macropomum]